MNNIIINKIYSKECGRFILSFFIVAVFFGLSSLICNRVFFINDDENIMYTISGYYNYGIPYDHSFLNYCLAYMLRFLYRIIPSVQWYGWFHLVVLFFSISFTFNIIFRVLYKNKKSILIGLVVELLLFVSVYLYPTLLMQFTTTSTFAGMAAAVILFGVDFKNDKKKQIIFDVCLSIIMLVLCYMHRKNTGYVIICFYFGVGCYQFLKLILARKIELKEEHKKGSFKALLFNHFTLRLFITFIVAVVLLMAVIEVDSFKRSTADWKAFYEYDEARFKALDYPHDSYTDNPTLYDDLGWSPELYELGMTNWWFFMDPRINPDSFTAIAQTGYYKEKTIDLHSIISVAKSMYESSLISKTSVWFSIVVIIIGIIAFLLSIKRHYCESLLGLCLLIGSALLILYLCYRQRLPLRAFQVVIIPFVSLWTMLILTVCDKVDFKMRRVGLVCFITFSVFLASAFGYINSKTAREHSLDRESKSYNTLSIEQYAIAHPNNIYIYDTSLTFRYMAFVVYDNKYPSNLFFWGGMGWNSPSFNKQLQQNNLKLLFSDVLFEDNVYYISSDAYAPREMTMRERMEAYMDSTYGNCNFEICDCISDSIKVYKISK